MQKNNIEQKLTSRLKFNCFCKFAWHILSSNVFTLTSFSRWILVRFHHIRQKVFSWELFIRLRPSSATSATCCLVVLQISTGSRFSISLNSWKLVCPVSNLHRGVSWLAVWSSQILLASFQKVFWNCWLDWCHPEPESIQKTVIWRFRGETGMSYFLSYFSFNFKC